MSRSNRYDLVRRGIPSKVDKRIFPKDINILIKCVPFMSEKKLNSLQILEVLENGAKKWTKSE
jgi:hypothetical protein